MPHRWIQKEGRSTVTHFPSDNLEIFSEMVENDDSLHTAVIAKSKWLNKARHCDFCIENLEHSENEDGFIVVKIRVNIATHLSANVNAYAPCARYIFLTGKNVTALSELILQMVLYFHISSHVKPQRLKMYMQKRT